MSTPFSISPYYIDSNTLLLAGMMTCISQRYVNLVIQREVVRNGDRAQLVVRGWRSITLNVSGRLGHHRRHWLISEAMLEIELLRSQIVSLLVPRCAAGLGYTPTPFTGVWRLEARAVVGGRQVVVDRRDRLPERDHSSPGVVTVPVQHVRLHGMEDGPGWTVLSRSSNLLDVVRRRPGGYSYDCGPRGYWGGHQQLAGTRKRIEVRKGS